MAYEGLALPTNPTTSAVYSWAVNHVIQLRRVLADLNTAVPDIASLTTELDSLKSRVTVLEGTGSGSSLTPQQLAELELITAVDAKIGSVAELNKRIKTHLEYQADATIHAAIEAHRATTGVRTQVSVSEGLATRIDSVTASLGVTNGNVTTLQTAMANGDAALAASISTVSTQVAGNTASITSQQASINGIYAASTVTVSVGGRVVGTQTISGSPLASFFDVDADYFRIGNASFANKPVFQIGTKNGIADIVFHGNLIGDGTITANALAANVITASKIVAGAVTASALASGAVGPSALAADAVTTAAIAPSAVTEAEIADAAIVASKIAAGQITADKLNVGSLSAINANLGTVTAGTIQNPAGTLIDDLANLKRYRSDGSMTLDFSTKFFEMIF